jgi:hypothetical protein
MSASAGVQARLCADVLAHSQSRSSGVIDSMNMLDHAVSADIQQEEGVVLRSTAIEQAQVMGDVALLHPFLAFERMDVQGGISGIILQTSNGGAYRLLRVGRQMVPGFCEGAMDLDMVRKLDVWLMHGGAAFL